MKRSVRRSIGAAALAVGIAGSVAGCSSSGPADTAQSKAAQAAINSAVDNSVRMGSAAVSMVTTAKSGATTNTTQAAGLVSFDRSTGSLLLVVPGSKTRAEERAANGVMYVKITSPTLPAKAKGKWIKVNLSDTADLNRIGVGTLPPVGAILTQMKSLGGAARLVNQVTVGSALLTKYQVVITQDQLIAKATKLFGANSNSVAALKAAPKGTHATIDIFISKDNRIAREIETLALPILGKYNSTTTDISLSKYGTSIPIGHPVPSAVIDVKQLFTAPGTSGAGGAVSGN